MEKIWLPHYPEGVPSEINPDHYSSLIDMFEQATQNYADRVAFINMEQTLTFRELEEKSRAFAAYLQHETKLKQGDRIALMLPNLLQYPIALFGALRAGLVVVNVNPLYTARELEYQLKDSGGLAIVIATNFAHTLEKALYNTDVKTVIVTEVGDMLPPFKRALTHFILKYIQKAVPKYRLTNAIKLHNILKIGQSLPYEKPLINHRDVAFLQYTGGTTGASKGAMLTHRNMLANLEQIKAAYGQLLNQGEERVVTILPLYHVFALTINGLLFVELGGSNLLITNPRDTKNVINALNSHAFTAISGVNTLFAQLVNHPDIENVDFSTMRFSIAGGTAVQQQVAEKWQKLTGKPILEGYGLTECSPVVCGNSYNLTNYSGNIGFPLPSTDVQILDDDGNPAPVGEAGELTISGPQVMEGYWEHPEETELVLKNGWLSTGDIVVMDETGTLRVVDRKKDLILVSGFNVYPTEIEDIISRHEKVSEVVAIGWPSEKTGELVKVYVVKKDESLTEEEVIAHCRQFLTGYKIPKVIEFMEELPKSTVGKILRRELRCKTGIIVNPN